MNTFERDKKYIASTYGRFPIEIVRGKGSLVWDVDGKEYIDLSTGIGVNSLGICDEEWKSAVIAQLDVLSHTSNLYYSAPCTRLAEMLSERTGLKKTFFSNSGAEANECAIKVARKYSEDKYGENRYKIITLENSFHGRTITTLAATGQEVFHKLFTPLTAGFVHAKPNNLQSVKDLLAGGDVAAIMLEVVQGESGVIPLDKEFLEGVYKLCQEKDVLLICDEVQCGNGRCGELYAYMNYDVHPDIVTTAKGLAGGLPLGATMLGEKVENVLTPSTHGSTFGGNPICSAGAVNILSRIDEKLLDGVRKKSERIFKTLRAAKGVKSVTGLGLMIGIETEKDAGEVIAECMKNGVLVIKAKQKVRLLPALNIDDELLDKALKVLINAL